MTIFRNVKLGVFRQYQNTKAILKKNIVQNRFKKLSKFQKSQLSNFNLTLLNEGKMNSVWFNLLQRIAAKNGNVRHTYLKKRLNYRQNNL